MFRNNKSYFKITDVLYQLELLGFSILIKEMDVYSYTDGDKKLIVMKDGLDKDAYIYCFYYEYIRVSSKIKVNFNGEEKAKLFVKQDKDYPFRKSFFEYEYNVRDKQTLVLFQQTCGTNLSKLKKHPFIGNKIKTLKLDDILL